MHLDLLQLSSLLPCTAFIRLGGREYPIQNKDFIEVSNLQLIQSQGRINYSKPSWVAVDMIRQESYYALDLSF